MKPLFVLSLRPLHPVTFLREHDLNVYQEVRGAYVDTMGRVLRQALANYVVGRVC